MNKFTGWCGAIERILGRPIPNADGYGDGPTVHTLHDWYFQEMSPLTAAGIIDASWPQGDS